MNPENVLPDSLVISSESFLNLLSSLVNNFGSAGESMVFQMGRENGINFCRGIIGKIDDSGKSLEDLFNLVLEKASEVGWARMIANEFNPQTGSIKVVLQDNAFKDFCLAINLPQCFFLRGYLSGIIKELTNVDYSFSHSECYAHGHEHCSIKMVAE